MKLCRAAAAALILCCGTQAQAQAVGIMVVSTGSDPVGTRLAVRLKESIARSPLFRLVYDESDAVAKVSLVTLEPSTSSGDMTVYSEVITIPRKTNLDLFLTSAVGNCGSNKIDTCADTIKADVDGQITMMRQALSAKRE